MLRDWLPTFSLLIGIFLTGSQSSWGDDPPAAAPAAEDQSAEDTTELARQFATDYRLEPGEVLRWIPRPFPPSRLAFYTLTQGGQAQAIPRGPDTMYVRYQNGKPRIWTMTFGSEERSIADLCTYLLNIQPQQLSADPTLLERSLSGDFVYNTDAPQAELVLALQQLLRENGIGVKMTFQDVEQDVYVCRGQYEFSPLPESPGKRVEFYGLELDTDGSGYGGGSGDLEEMLAEAGEWIGRRIVNDAAAPPEAEMSWHRNLDSTFSADARKLARDPETVLNNLTAQTGLTFTPERRSVRTLVIKELLPKNKANRE